MGSATTLLMKCGALLILREAAMTLFRVEIVASDGRSPVESEADLATPADIWNWIANLVAHDTFGEAMIRVRDRDGDTVVLTGIRAARAVAALRQAA